MGRRRKAREEALKMLYEFDARQADLEEIIAYYWDNFSKVKDKVVKDYANELARGCVEKRDFIDEKIEEVSKHWNLKRMLIVDKSILRIAVFELLYKKVPVPVLIDEAIEIAKKYGSDKSPGFINGILDAINKKQLR